MDPAVGPADRTVDIGELRLHVRDWPGAGRPFVLLHGLASNARTWDAVARRLQAAGHRVIAVDQRGHGLSDKPEDGYGFDEVTADLRSLLMALDLDDPVVGGQSWGGHVVVEFAARYPGLTRGVVLVDGGFMEMSSRPGATWERISVELKPPDLRGRRRDEIAALMRRMQPDWSDEGIEATLWNFETLPDGTVRPWLSLDRHMKILRALWAHRPSDIYPRLSVPVLLGVAGTADDSPLKRDVVSRVTAASAAVRLRWFAGAAHDIHVHRPDELAGWILDAVGEGLFW